MGKSNKYLVGGLAGVIAGVGLTVGALQIKSPSERAINIEKQDMPRIMKVYNKLWGNRITDQILVENPNNAGEYILLSDYLERFDNKYERNLERAKIKFLVSQGEEEK